MFAGCLFLRFKDGRKIRQINLSQTLMNLQYTFFLPQGVEIELIFALRPVVSKIQANFKIAIFGHETWQVAKIPEVAHVCLFLTQGVEIELIFALRAAISKIQSNFRDCRIWA